MHSFDLDDLLIGLTPDATIYTAQTGEVQIQTVDATLVLGVLGSAHQVALSELATSPRRLYDLAERVLAHEGLTGLSLLYRHLGRFQQMGLLCYCLEVSGKQVATCIPHMRGFRITRPDIAPYGYILSRFAYIRRERHAFQIESPLGLGRLVVHEPYVLALVAQLAVPSTFDSLCANIPQLSRDQVGILLSMLWSSGALSLADERSAAAEDQQHNLRQWEFHDLLFHHLSRPGRQRNRYGATQRFKGRIEPPPKLKYYPGEAERVTLALPDPMAIQQSDMLLSRALEQRCSIRTPGQPLTLAQLSTFLYRCARIRRPTQVEARTGGGLPEPRAYLRPYPGGGGRYELELYLSVQRCEGLEPGFYHYQPLEHMLTRVRSYDVYVQRMLEYAMQATSVPEPPDVLITLAACFQRMTWRYEAMAYAAILKDVGVVYQTMYLVATAMGLAPCALGSGNAALFAAAAGTDYYVESSVGEFMLSGGPAGP